MSKRQLTFITKEDKIVVTNGCNGFNIDTTKPWDQKELLRRLDKVYGMGYGSGYFEGYSDIPNRAKAEAIRDA